MPIKVRHTNREILKKPHYNHKENRYRNYTKEKGIKTYQYKTCSCFERKIARDKKRDEGTTKQTEIVLKKAIVNPSLPVITLNVNDLNCPIKRYRVID